MTRSGPTRLPSVLQLDGRRYSVEGLPGEIKMLILDLQKADAVVQNRRRMVLVLKAARDDLKAKLNQALEQQSQTSDQPSAPPVAPLPYQEPMDATAPVNDQTIETAAQAGTVRRAKDKVKGLLRRFMGRSGD
jgi:hypothetical protein